MDITNVVDSHASKEGKMYCVYMYYYCALKKVQLAKFFNKSNLFRYPSLAHQSDFLVNLLKNELFYSY